MTGHRRQRPLPPVITGSSRARSTHLCIKQQQPDQKSRFKWQEKASGGEKSTHSTVFMLR